MRRFVHRTFEGAMKATIGADFMVKEIELGQARFLNSHFHWFSIKMD